LAAKLHDRGIKVCKWFGEEEKIGDMISYISWRSSKCGVPHAFSLSVLIVEMLHYAILLPSVDWWLQHLEVEKREIFPAFRSGLIIG
jgi:hypothetical protein